MDAAAAPPHRLPLTVLIPAIGVLGGLAGGFAVSLLVVLWSWIESGGRDVALVAILFGLWAGFILGAMMGVLASLLRILIGVHFGLTGELVAVSVGALLTPLVFLGALGALGWMVVPFLIIGALAAWQFCRTVLKRAQQEAPEIGPY